MSAWMKDIATAAAEDKRDSRTRTVAALRRALDALDHPGIISLEQERQKVVVDRLITDADAWEISDPVTKDLRPEMRNA